MQSYFTGWKIARHFFYISSVGLILKRGVFIGVNNVSRCALRDPVSCMSFLLFQSFSSRCCGVAMPHIPFTIRIRVAVCQKKTIYS